MASPSATVSRLIIKSNERRGPSGPLAASKGQTVDFQAFDLYRVKDGRIVENWRLEDTLMLLKQLGAVKP